MLPLSIYLSAEYSVLDLRTLYRAFEHYLYMPDSDIEAALHPFLIHPLSEPINSGLQELEEIQLYEPIDQAEANRNFNHYLSLVQPDENSGGSGDLGHPLFIYPQHLHPRFNALSYSRIEKDLLKRLIPLIPEQGSRQVFLAPINEDRLGVELQLLVQLVRSIDRTGAIGICVSCASKRALPLIGWLKKLAQDEGVQIPVCLVRGYKIAEQARTALAEALPDYPILRSNALIDAQYRFAFEFLNSANGAGLIPLLIDPPTDLIERAQSKGWPVFSAFHWNDIDPKLDQLPSPAELFADERRRAEGFMPSQQGLSDAISREIDLLCNSQRPVQPIINGTLRQGSETVDICATQDVNQVIGQRMIPTEDQVREALSVVEGAQRSWDLQPVEERSRRVMEFARLVNEKRLEIATLLAYETGKPIRHAINEVRDAVDLAYYYCSAATTQLASQELFEDRFSQHRLELHGRGVFLAIPSSETPVAELVGSGSAALLTGNGLVIKPTENASMTSMRLFELLLQAWIPSALVAYLPGGLREIGNWLLEDYRVNGVTFTGLGAKASEISAQLANRPGAQLIPVVVNSEGQSLVIIDSDQEIHANLPRLLSESFSASSQYPLCSHVLYVEESVAQQYEAAISNAISLINLGSPLSLQTDLGPVSSIYRLNALHDQIERWRAKGRILAEQPTLEQHEHGLFVSPTVIRLYTLDELQQVIPGPLLYIIRFSRDDIDRVINEINRTGYGLSLSLFSDNPILRHKIARQVQVGNLNFNHPEPRASGGALPMGGTGPSGTGPQIGGPHYLRHFTSERTVVTYSG